MSSYLAEWIAVFFIATIIVRPPANAAGPVFLGRDNTRCNYDGKIEPVDLKLTGLYPNPSDDPNVMFLASPAVSQGRVFGATCDFDPPQTYGTAFCLDAKSMRPLWSVDEFEDPLTGKLEEMKGIFSSPAVSADGKFVIYGQGAHFDKNSHLICFHAQTGKLHWAIRSELHIECSPTISGDVVIVGCGAIENKKTNKPMGNPGYLMAIKISDGTLLWKHAINDPETAPAILDDVVFAGSSVNGNKVVALRMGLDRMIESQNLTREIWSTSVDFPVTSPITLSDGLVIAGCGAGTYQSSGKSPGGGVVALDQKTGALKWKFRLRDAVFGAVAVKDSTAVVTCKSGEVIALSVTTGKVLWQRTPAPGQSILAGSVFTGNYVYTVTDAGYLVVIDASNSGRLIQKVYINDRTFLGNNDYTISTPSLIDGHLYVGSETGGLRCYK